VPTPRQILHATDFSEQADAAFDLAWSLAQALGARLTVLHVTRPPVVVDCDGLATALPQVHTALSQGRLP